MLGDIAFVREHDRDIPLRFSCWKMAITSCWFSCQGSGGLVRQQNRRLVDQGPRDGGSLLLAARELVGMVIGLLQPGLSASGMAARGRLQAAAIEQRQLDIVERRGARQEIETLEHEAVFLLRTAASASFDMRERLARQKY
jgi:hypothetical protein